jgi:hypothetical protein
MSLSIRNLINNLVNNLVNKLTNNTYMSNNKDSVFVGRWIVSNSNHKYNDNINIIIDRNNEDHCGVCNINNNINKNKKLENYYKTFMI